MNETEAIQMLQTRPLDFLRKNSITPYAAPGVAGIHNFYMVDTLQQIQRPDDNWVIYGCIKDNDFKSAQIT